VLSGLLYILGVECAVGYITPKEEIVNIVAVILGGGRGTRLFPLTRDRSKPAVPIGGKYRLIDIPVSNCINDNIHQILVLTQYNSESLNRHIARSYRFDRFSGGFVSILAAEQTHENQDWFQGTADAVRQSLKHIKSLNPDLILVLSGDQLYRMNFREFARHHIDTGADISIATKPVNSIEAPSLGIMKVNSDGIIKKFREKPATEELGGLRSSQYGVTDDRPFLGSMGIYMFTAGVLEDVLNNNPDVTDFGKEIIPGSINRLKVMSFMFDGYWSDIGTIESFFRANLDMARTDPDFDMYHDISPLFTRARALPGARVNESSLKNTIICDASDVSGAELENCIIGIRGKVGKGTVMENCVFMGADYWEGHFSDPRNSNPAWPRLGIGENCEIRNAIIDKNARIGDNCTLTNRKRIKNIDYDSDFDSYHIRDYIIIIPKDAVIKQGTEI